MEKGERIFLRHLVFIFNSMAVFSIGIFLKISTEKVIDNYIAREFLEQVPAIPENPDRLVIQLVILLILLGISFWIRDFFFKENIVLIYLSIIFDFVISMIIIRLLDFNYNGILLWVFSNLILHIKEVKGKYFFIAVAIISYVGTEHGIMGMGNNLFDIRDYISLYSGNGYRLLLLIYHTVLSLNIVIFLLLCIYIIMEQNGTIIEVKNLYRKLSDTNKELEEANVKLHEYAIMKEKMGETKERNRLAREIHDTLGHTLTGISAGIDACIAIIDISPESTKKQLEIISQATRSGIKEVRRSVSELRPDALERLSLQHALKKMVSDTNAMAVTKIHFDCKLEILHFDEDEENAIYRIVQESITNSIRHGKAKNIYITIDKKDFDIHIEIKDDGIGCKELKKGFGTRHITERIKMLNGSVQFCGDNGFTTKVRIPIRWGEKYD